MNLSKIDIMQRVTFCNVPQGAYLRQDSHPALQGVLIAKITPNDGSNGLDVVRARMFFEGVEAIMADVGPVPDSAMLRRLHEACIRMTKGTMSSLTITDLAKQLAAEHRTMIGVIREVASELKLAYDPPDDPFLEAA